MWESQSERRTDSIKFDILKDDLYSITDFGQIMSAIPTVGQVDKKTQKQHV